MNQEQMAAKTILIVEDDTDIGSMLLQVVTYETAYHAILAIDSLEALNIIKETQPVLFILDYWLPYMNGIELYDHLRTHTGLERTPAIMMSAGLPHNELAKRDIVGIKKPFDLDNFLQTIETLLTSSSLH